MSDDTASGGSVEQGSGVPVGPRPGSWIGAAVSAVGIAACVTIVVYGNTALMNEGGFVASGGPYVIAHPAPAGFWILPVAFLGMFGFPALHAVFASRIRGFSLLFATWCAIWTVDGAVTLWYGFNPPGGPGLSWGWLVQGTIFVIVGLVSTVLYLLSLWRGWAERKAEAVGARLWGYAAMTLAAIIAGVYLGYQAYVAVIVR